MQILIIDHFTIMGDALAGALKDINPAFNSVKATDVERFALENPKLTPAIILLLTNSSAANSPARKDTQIRMAKALYPKSKLIVYDNEPERNLKKFLSMGMDGYLSPAALWSDLKTCIEMVAKGKKFVEIDILAKFWNTTGFKNNRHI